MKIKTAMNPSWANADHTAINLTVEFEEFSGTVPFTAHSNDSEPHGRELFRRGVLGEFGAPKEFQPIAATPVSKVPESVTPLQAFFALESKGMLQKVYDYMALPSTPAIAKLAFTGATVWKRDSLLVMNVAFTCGFTPSQVDDLFVLAASIQV